MALSRPGRPPARAKKARERPDPSRPRRGGHLEIERKFLVRSLPPQLDLFEGASIVQGYLNADEDTREVRLRAEKGRWLLTFKQGGGTVRQETEVRLSEAQFAALWPLTRGRRIVKTRFQIPHPHGVIPLDLYAGKLRGLATVEMEFRSTTDCRKFRPPPWVGQEVTGDPRFKNRQLATRTTPGSLARPMARSSPTRRRRLIQRQPGTQR